MDFENDNRTEDDSSDDSYSSSAGEEEGEKGEGEGGELAAFDGGIEIELYSEEDEGGDVGLVIKNVQSPDVQPLSDEGSDLEVFPQEKGVGVVLQSPSPSSSDYSPVKPRDVIIDKDDVKM